MGLFDLFRMGKVIVGTVNAVRDQRSLARDLGGLPMADFVRECLLNLNQSGGAWHAHARPANDNAAAIAAAKQLPPELAEFYSTCDGFGSSDEEFPAAHRGAASRCRLHSSSFRAASLLLERARKRVGGAWSAVDPATE